jgi:acyl phosphate:glycerol-3-phosphate acyltransferase
LLEHILKIALSYLLGSLLGSLIIGKLRGGVDIRKLGSGNAGGTNALRTQGLWFAIGVMIIDVGKGWFAVAVLPHLQLAPLASVETEINWLSLSCGAAVVIGHVYPMWFGFRGGKGAATLIGIVLGFSPTAALVVIGVWTMVLLLSGYVGLATMVAAAFFPIHAVLVLQSIPLALFGLATAAFVTFTHRTNLARMRAGTENRATKLWLLRPR